jgi:hypothetical protein
VVLQDPALVLGNHLLAAFDLGVVELLDLAARRADQVVVVRAFVQLVDRLAAFEVAALQDAGLLELREHAVHRGQADVGMLVQQHAKHVFGRHVPLAAGLEDLENLQAWQCGLEAGILEFVDIGHVDSCTRCCGRGPEKASRYNGRSYRYPFFLPCLPFSNAVPGCWLLPSPRRSSSVPAAVSAIARVARCLPSPLQGRSGAGQFRVQGAGRGAQARHVAPAGA